MKKRAYSLTKKERKARQEMQKEKAGVISQSEKTVVESESVLPEENSAIGEEQAAKTERKTVLVITAVILAAVILITTAILLPILFTTVYRYRDINNPVARMELSNGMVLEYEIFEDTCPIAASNFIFLARIGYFDNTIIFDSQNNWVRFGGYETETAHRSANKTFTDTVEGINKYPNSKFGYRLKADTSSEAKMYDQKGILAFLYNDTATEFQVAAIDGAQLTVQGTYSKEYRVTACGRAFEESMPYIEEIAAMARNEQSQHSTWKAPQPTITIKKVKLYNLDRKKWKHFGFDDYFYGNSYISNWVNTN